MKRSFTTTLTLTGILAFLAAWYVFYELKYRPKATEKEEKSKIILLTEKDQIQEIDIVRVTNPPNDAEGEALSKIPLEDQKLETVKLRKTGQDWAITAPVQDSADSATILSILSTLTTTKEERVVDEKPASLENFGLSKPLIHVFIRKAANSPAEELLVGKNTPVGFSSYIKTSNKETVYKVNRSLRSTLDKKPFDLRNKSIFTTPKTEISEMEIQVGKEDVVLKKDDKDNWVLARENFPADSAEANKVFIAFFEAKANAFVSEIATDAGKFGLANTTTKIIFTKKDKTKLTLLLSKQKDKVYAKRDDKPFIYEVDKTLWEKLDKKGASYRDMHLALFNRYDIKKIKIERTKDIQFELNKGENANWTFGADTSIKINSSQVDMLLTSLQDIKVTKFQSTTKEKNPIKDPRITIRLFEKSEKGDIEKVALLVGKSAAKEVSVERSDISPLISIREEDYNKLNLTKDSFIQKEVPPPAPEIKTPEPKKS